MMVKNFLLILLTNFSSPRVLECHVKNYIPINIKKSILLKKMNVIFVMRCAIWYQTPKNGVQMVGQNTVLTS